MKEVFLSVLVGVIFAFQNGLFAGESGFSLNLSENLYRSGLKIQVLIEGKKPKNSNRISISDSSHPAQQGSLLLAAGFPSVPGSAASQTGSDREDLQIKGVVLAFHQWPLNEEQTGEVLKRAKELGLEKKEELPVFKTWIFEWSERKKGVNVQQLCGRFSNLSFLKYCEPDVLLEPGS